MTGRLLDLLDRLMRYGWPLLVMAALAVVVLVIGGQPEMFAPVLGVVALVVALGLTRFLPRPRNRGAA